jgi:hypothetical protein
VAVEPKIQREAIQYSVQLQALVVVKAVQETPMVQQVVLAAVLVLHKEQHVAVAQAIKVLILQAKVVQAEQQRQMTNQHYQQQAVVEQEQLEQIVLDSKVAMAVLEQQVLTLAHL